MMNSFVICIDGHDDDSIPKVRRFYTAFHQAWPYWLYFCNLEADSLKMMVACIVDQLSAMKVDGAPSHRGIRTAGIARFPQADIPRMNAICDRAQMFEHLVYQRSNDVFEYFEFGPGSDSLR